MFSPVKSIAAGLGEGRAAGLGDTAGSKDQDQDLDEYGAAMFAALGVAPLSASTDEGQTFQEWLNQETDKLLEDEDE